MSWMQTLTTHAATRWVAGGLLALGGWTLYQAAHQTATAQTAPPAPPSPTETALPEPAPPSQTAYGDGARPSPAARVPERQIKGLVSDRLSAERNHLWRVAAWGSTNIAGGLALRLASDQTDTRAFGFQSAAWGAVNVGIAAAGLLNARDRPTTWQNALSAERQYHDILLANLGLNVGYASVGTAMVVASAYDVDDAAAWRGHGSALILQGAGLLVLDAIAWVGSRGRIVDLIGMPGNLSARSLPVGGALTWRF